MSPQNGFFIALFKLMIRANLLSYALFSNLLLSSRMTCSVAEFRTREDMRRAIKELDYTHHRGERIEVFEVFFISRIISMMLDEITHFPILKFKNSRIAHHEATPEFWADLHHRRREEEVQEGIGKDPKIDIKIERQLGNQSINCFLTFFFSFSFSFALLVFDHSPSRSRSPKRYVERYFTANYPPWYTINISQCLSVIRTRGSRSPSPAAKRRRTRSPSPSPRRSRTRSPSPRRSRSRSKSRSLSRSKSPARSRSVSPRKSRSRTPSPSRKGSRSPSPGRGSSPVAKIGSTSRSGIISYNYANKKFFLSSFVDINWTVMLWSRAFSEQADSINWFPSSTPWLFFQQLRRKAVAHLPSDLFIHFGDFDTQQCRRVLLVVNTNFRYLSCQLFVYLVSAFIRKLWFSARDCDDNYPSYYWRAFHCLALVPVSDIKTILSDFLKLSPLSVYIYIYIIYIYIS